MLFAVQSYVLSPSFKDALAEAKDKVGLHMILKTLSSSISTLTKQKQKTAATKGIKNFN